MAVKRLLLTLLFKNVIKSFLVFNIRPKLLRIHSKIFLSYPANEQKESRQTQAVAVFSPKVEVNIAVTFCSSPA